MAAPKHIEILMGRFDMVALQRETNWSINLHSHVRQIVPLVPGAAEQPDAA